MVTQINLKFQEDFYELAKNYAQARGYMSVQELAREALRDKIFENMDLQEDYKKVLEGKEANTFRSEQDSKTFIDSLRKKADENL